MIRIRSLPAGAAGLAAIGLAMLAPAAALARFVDEGKLAQYCAEEAVVRLNVARDQLIVLPVEQVRGDFHVNVQTDERNPSFVECRFGPDRALISVHVTGAVHNEEETVSAPKAALRACFDRLGSRGKVLQVSQLRPGYKEIIIRARGSDRKVACTVTDDGIAIADWVEMN